MNKDKRVTIRFTTKEWEAICRRANREDMPLAEYLRAMIDKGERVRTDTDTLSW